MPDELTDKERDRRIQLMMQKLLIARFKLSVRQEVKDVPVYSLAVGKNGLKLTAVEGHRAGLCGGKDIWRHAVP